MQSIVAPLALIGLFTALASNTSRVPIPPELLERARSKPTNQILEAPIVKAPKLKTSLLTKTKWTKTELLELVGNSCERWSVSASLGKAVATVESSVNPNAESRFAIGLMQVTPKSARDICRIKDKKLLKNPVINADCGCQILAESLHFFNWDLTKGVKAYNGGPKCAYGGCKESDQYAPKIAKIFKGKVRLS